MTELAVDVKELSKRYGGLVAVSDISFQLQPGQVLGVIGPNGAGKTTLVNVVAGGQKPSSGSVTIGGAVTTGQPAHVVSKRGMARSFQQAAIFSEATVSENIAWAERFSSGLNSKIEVADLIEISGLGRLGGEEAGSLPYGIQKSLGLMMTLACKPIVALLDEPAAGLELHERHVIDRLVKYVSDHNTAVLIVEHDMGLIRRICPTVIVMDSGRVIASGDTSEALSRPDVIAAYLGVEEGEPLEGAAH